MEELDRLVDSLTSEASEADPEVLRQRAKLAMVDAWREIVPQLRYKAEAGSMAWLRRYEGSAFDQCARRITPLTKSDYGRGRPTASFQRFIDEANAIARESKLLEKHSLETVGVLPIGTVNSFALWIAPDSANSKMAVFQLGLHECIDGLLRAVVAIEGWLPFELFDDIDFKSDGWHDSYRAAIDDCIDAHDEVISFVEHLLLRTLFVGHPQGMHHFPLATSSRELHRILLRHVELFRIGHEIGHVVAAAQGPHGAGSLPLHIGPTVVAVAPSTPEEEFIADMIGGGISDAGRPQRGRRMSAEVFRYAGVAPDLCLSMFALLEDAVTALGGCRVALDWHTSARARRQVRRDLLSEWGDKPGIVLGQRLQFVLEAVQRLILPKLKECIQRGAALSAVWHG
ncbi:hypothetical protein [Chromobacterium sp. IIBBL 290-4]|uniref:hypothetical protein n=1 Tax=Chromobacterium sp. IIBBL 290-4 TaxID=2953890 RepID=UPI0020B83331|nr:hypothetical protein [Chromobacterium sp. IIBBL 290-4]UTH74200.1 hypothetical protein NKT35_22115 [Chromobacterium sp. IIBBL 290-4]